MEKRLRRIEILMAVILAFVVINFFVSLKSDEKEPVTKEVEMTEVKQLPADITREYLDKTVSRVQTHFNRTDWPGVYSIFGDYSKAQLTEEDISQGFKKLSSAIGHINSYAYSHYVYEGDGNKADWFEIHYKCRFDNGKGTIKLSTRTVDQVTEIVGIVINLDEL